MPKILISVGLLAGITGKPMLLSPRDPGQITLLARQAELAARTLYGTPAPEGLSLVVVNVHRLEPQHQDQLANHPANAVLCVGGDPTRMTAELRRALIFRTVVDTGPDQELVNVPATSKATASRHSLHTLQQRLPAVVLLPEVRQYIQDLVVFARSHRMVRRGVPARAAADIELLVRAHCVASSMAYATPAVVAVAARGYLTLKIDMIKPSEDQTLQYGTDITVVEQQCQAYGGDLELVVQEVLEAVPLPA